MTHEVQAHDLAGHEAGISPEVIPANNQPDKEHEMTDTKTSFHMTGDMNKLLLADIAELYFPEKTINEEALLTELVAERITSDAWCVWWIARNGDAGMNVKSEQGKRALESLAAFHAGWIGATK